MTQTDRAFFKIVGMYCITCKPIVEKQSKKNETGIKKIDIEYMTNNVVVDFDPFLINTGEIKKRLERSGYKFVRVAR